MAELTLAQKKALALAKARLRMSQGQPQQPKELAWSDVPMEALRNTPSSAGQFVSDMVQPILHPVDTANTMLDLAAGGISRGIEAVAGDQSWLPENKATATADAVGQFYKGRYGSEEGFKQAIATDPLGVLGDFSTFVTGGSGAAARAPGIIGKAGRVGKTVGNLTNPVTPVAIASRHGAKAVGAVAKPILGVTTGTGSDTIGEAYKAGRTGGAYKKAFTDNMRGEGSQTSVVEDAKMAVGNIASARAKQYQENMARIGADQKPVNMDPITTAYFDALDSLYEGNLLKASDETLAKLDKIGTEIAKWQADPAPNNAKKIDALKIRIDQLMPSFTEAGNSERVVTQMRNAVKQAIVDQVPEYADAMRAYEDSITAQKEIERSLSIGKKNTADQALRKLQSLTRNNANTNYGSRVESAKILEQAGATELMPKLAGQALNSKMPRGIQQLVAGGAIGAGLFNPAAWPAVVAALAASSPRLVGEGSSAAGTLARRTKGAREASPVVAALLRLIGSTAEAGSQLPPQ